MWGGADAVSLAEMEDVYFPLCPEDMVPQTVLMHLYITPSAFLHAFFKTAC